MGRIPVQQNLLILQNPDRLCHVNIYCPEKREEILFLRQERKPRCGAVQKLCKEHTVRLRLLQSRHSPRITQNLSLVLTGDSDVMTEQEDRKGYVDSQHHHRAEGQQSSLCTSHPELKGLLALMFCVLIKEAAVNGCSLPCPLATRYLNTCKGRGRVLLKSGIPACHSGFFYSPKRYFFFFSRLEPCLL